MQGPVSGRTLLDEMIERVHHKMQAYGLQIAQSYRIRYTIVGSSGTQ